MPRGRPIIGASTGGVRVGNAFGRLKKGSLGGELEPQQIILLSAATVAEDASLATLIGTFSVLNGSGTYVYTLTDDGAGATTIANDDELVTDAVLDFETVPSFNITVEADNSVDPVLERTFTITVTDVFEEPPDDDMSADFSSARMSMYVAILEDF
jgi:hypothetical protein